MLWASKQVALEHGVERVPLLFGETEHLDEDPAFYKKFSQLIDETIRAFQDKRLTEGQYLETILKSRDNLVKGSTDATPSILNGKPEARAFYGILSESILPPSIEPLPTSFTEPIAKMGVEITDIIQRLTIRDWKRNDDVQKQMKMQTKILIL